MVDKEKLKWKQFLLYKFLDLKEKELKKQYEDLFANPYNAARKGYIDDVIEPANTRFRLIRALEMLADKDQRNPDIKHSNMPL